MQNMDAIIGYPYEWSFLRESNFHGDREHAYETQP
jgi:hypothetical protein